MISSPTRSNTHRISADSSAIREEKVVDYRGKAESMLPVSEASNVQLRPGPAPTNLEIFSSENVFVLGLQHHTSSVGVIVLKADWMGYMWWDGNEECRINGELARSLPIYAQGKQDGFYAAGGARRTMGIAVNRNRLIETISALSGVGPEDVLLERAVLELLPEAALRFRSGIGSILKDSIGDAATNSVASNTESASESIMGLLVDAYLNSPPVQHRYDRPRRPEQIVRQAEERFFASVDTSISLADLCAATGVSQSTLYRAFDAVCCEPPLSYFHKRRLTNARSALVRSPAVRGGVRQAALAAGLTEFGRFSVEYRQLFGESPSTTLRRSVVD